VEIAIGLWDAILEIDDWEMRNISGDRNQQLPETTDQEAGTNQVTKPQPHSGVPQPSISSPTLKGDRMMIQPCNWCAKKEVECWKQTG
jgi:hypothetical protein